MNDEITRDRERREVDWRVRMLLPVGLLLLRCLAATWRITECNADGWRRRSANKQGWILSLWHGTLLVMAYRHRKQDMVVLVSEHRDGELIARTLHAWGYRTVRGSTTRGGGRALLGMIRELESGSAIAVTPDGPQGPPKIYQPGALVAAHRVGVPIVAVGVHVDRAWRLRSWDALVIPKPFARLILAYGSPTLVEGATSREAATSGPRFEGLMAAAQRRADG